MNVTIPEGVISIGSAAFFNCNKLTNVSFPTSLTNIGSSAFCGTGLSDVSIPLSVNNIGVGAFSGTPWLQENYDLAEEGLFYVDNILFGWKSESNIITEMTRPEGQINIRYGTRLIASGVFEGTSITGVTIPEGVIGISDEAFKKCKNLTTVNIPSSVVSIGNSAFSNCERLESITLPSTMDFLGSSAFENCTALTSVTIPSGVRSIEDNSFFGCSNLSSVSIPNSVTSIGDYAFFMCKSLNNIKIPSTVSYIGTYPFSNTPWYQSHFESAPDGLFYIDNILFGYKGNRPSGEIEIREGTKIIAGSACRSSALTSITIPDGLTGIGNNAFYGCSIMKSITLPSSVTKIGSEAFFNCVDLEQVISHIQDPFEISNDVFHKNVQNNNRTQQMFSTATLYVPKDTKDKYKTTSAWNQFMTIEEIEDSDQPKGDVNGDQTVDVADIASVIDVMAAGTNDAAADVNGDGTVDVADIAEIIDEMAAQARQQDIED